MSLPLSMRLVDWLGPRVEKPIARMGLDEIREAQRQSIPRNAFTHWLYGKPSSRVRIVVDQAVGRAGAIPLRLYRPGGSGPHAVVVHYHGGGWVLGGLDGADWLCSRLAERTGALVVSVDYRLAPQHPFPAAVDDAWDALTWVASHADRLDADRDRIAVMGDSAGGNLAAVVALLARDEGAPRLRRQVLIYPATDATMSQPSIEEFRDGPLLTHADMRVYLHHYLGTETDRQDPLVSPLFAEDLSGVAPALVQTAEYDPLRDEGRAYAERLRAAEVPTRFTEYVRAPHGYCSLPNLGEGAWQALGEISQVLRADFAESDDPHIQ